VPVSLTNWRGTALILAQWLLVRSKCWGNNGGYGN